MTCLSIVPIIASAVFGTSRPPLSLIYSIKSKTLRLKQDAKLNFTESSLDLACEAALDAMGYDEETGTYKIDKDSIDLIVFATVTPDDIVPCMSSQLKKRLGMKNTAAFNINTAYSG